MRKVPFIVGQYYHIYNRGTDKRIIFEDVFDLQRFIQSMEEFNTLEPIGSIYWNKYKKKSLRGSTSNKKLVDFVCYCLNPNHYHFILTPLVEKGIEQFMQRLGTGYTMFFNEKYHRTGALFQGRFKAVHIDSDEYLRYVNVYVNLNNRVHKIPLGAWNTKSSWDEYLGAKIIKDQNGNNQVQNNPNDICEKSMILSHFDTAEEYKKFAEETLEETIERKEEMSEYLLE